MVLILCKGNPTWEATCIQKEQWSTGRPQAQLSPARTNSSNLRTYWAATGTAFASPYQFFQPANLAKGNDTVLKRQQVLQEG
jgi:hypothetical protein